MEENEKHKMFLKIAAEMSTMSHCVSHKVCAILVKDNRILSTGINGTPHGFKNCDDVFDKNNFDRTDHHKFSEMFEVHAEANALLFAAKNGLSIEGSSLYCTLKPCNACLKMICNSGIKNIYYSDDYDLSDYDSNTESMIASCGVKLQKIEIKNE